MPSKDKSMFVHWHRTQLEVGTARERYSAVALCVYGVTRVLCVCSTTDLRKRESW